MSIFSVIFGSPKRYVGLCSLKRERKVPVYTNINKKPTQHTYNRGLQYFNTDSFRAKAAQNVYLAI